MPRGGCVLHSDGMVETVHEATPPQRTGGQRQRCGEWSTLSGANGAHRQARRAEETSTPQEDLDTLRGPEHSDDGLADDVRQRSHPGWVAHGGRGLHTARGGDMRW
jgi:hypothetical protein